MTTVLQILLTAAPLLLVTMGALTSEYAGRMACFLDGIINLGAFCCFAFTVVTKNAFLGYILSVASCVIITFLLEKLAAHFKANMFLAALAMNLFFSSVCTLCASYFFGTRSVLASELFTFNAPQARLATALVCYAASFTILALLRFTKTGLALRITGSDAPVLEARGISSASYRSLSWVIAAAAGSLCGCSLAFRISSFVPGMAAGRGWTALAAVFLGKKNPLVIIIAVLVFSAAEYAGSYLQNIPLFANMPSSVLLALPYLISLLLILIMPASKSFFPLHHKTGSHHYE